ncbi:MAG TPA: universal stress protein [Candidatus Eisenbacteria bacterium]|nr:universal stress protein [Candidatus Eisenbacteria bacterium]
MLQNRFKKILVPLDGSLNSIRGLNEAISLARQSDATITGIYVMPNFPLKVSRILKSYRSELKKNGEKIMSHARTSTARHGITFYERNAVSRDIVKTIVGYAKSSRSDIIVMGSRGEGSPLKEYLGSVTNGVLHDSKTPVLIVK